jgi:hypothetical protein
VRVCGCERVKAESCGERETVTLEVGGGVEGVEGPVGVAGEDVAVPPPQATSIKDKRFAVMVKNSLRPFLRAIDEERYRTDGIKNPPARMGVVGSVMTRKANDATSDVAEARLCGEEDRQAFEDLLRHRALDDVGDPTSCL